MGGNKYGLKLCRLQHLIFSSRLKSFFKCPGLTIKIVFSFKYIPFVSDSMSQRSF